jgi:hypothetical protein
MSFAEMKSFQEKQFKSLVTCLVLLLGMKISLSHYSPKRIL